MYKWNTSYDWLEERMLAASHTELRRLALELATVQTSDAIQELFGEEMDDDGYFDEVKDELR